MDDSQRAHRNDVGRRQRAAFARRSLDAEIPARRPKTGFGQFDDFFVLEFAGNRDDNVLRAVVSLVVLPNGIASDVGYGFVGAADWATEFVFAENLLEEGLVSHVLWVILVHGELFKNYGSFVIELVFV